MGRDASQAPATRRSRAGRFSPSRPDSPGSLGIAISEAVEVAAKNPDTKYALGSVLNHVLLHQTVIGIEAIEQMEMADAYPDVVIGCAGGGSNFAGIAFPFIGKKLKDKQKYAHPRRRARRVPVADAGKIRFRLRRHRASDAARQDAYAGLGVHSARLPCGRPALSRHGAAGQPLQGTGARSKRAPITRTRASRRA